MKTELTNAHRSQALILASEGVSGEQRFRDTTVPGLCIRIRGSRATWALMTRSNSIHIGEAEEMTLKSARERARDLLTERKPIVRKAVSVLMQAGMNSIDASLLARGVPIDPTDRYVDHLIWEDAMKAFLAFKIPTLSPRWASQVSRYAKHDVFFPVEFQPLSKLKYEHLDLIRSELRKSEPETTVSYIMSVAIQMLDWAWKERRTELGLAKLASPWWRDLKVARRAPGVRHIPTTEDIVRTLTVLDQANSICRFKLNALKFVVYTAQRVGQVCLTERSQIEYHDDGGATFHWTKNQTKNHKPHALTVPPSVARLVATEGKYAFPSGEDFEQRLSPTVLTRWFGDMWRPPVEDDDLSEVRPGPTRGTGRLPSVLRHAAIDRWTPHGVRAACASELIEQEMDAASSAILAHVPANRELPDRPRETSAEAVTLRFYNRSQRLILKSRGIEKWLSILSETEKRILEIPA